MQVAPSRRVGTITATASAVFFLLGCHFGAADTKQAAADTAADPCSRLREGREYVSVEELDCGPPVEGHPAPRCRSRITFSGDRYQWRHTDMVFVGEYRCDGLRIIGEEHSGRYQPTTGHLLWEGLDYQPAAK